MSFDPRSYGALGNGTHDDASAFQSAVNAAHAAGGEVVVSEGTYGFGSKVTIPADVNGVCSVYIRGAGPIGCTIQPLSSLDALFEAQGDFYEISGLYFTNLSSRCASALIHNAAPGAYTSEIKNNFFASFPTAILHKIGNGVIVKDNFANSNTSFFVSHDWAIATVIKDNTVLGGCLADFQAWATHGPEGVEISGNTCSIATTNSFAIHIRGGLDFSIFNNMLGELHNGSIIILDGGTASVNTDVRAIRIFDNWIGGNAAAPATGEVRNGIRLIDRPQEVSISDNEFDTLANGYGVSIEGTDPSSRPAQHVTISGNKFHMGSGSPGDLYINNVLYVTVDKNTMLGGTNSIVRGGGTTTATVTGNVFAQTPQRGSSDIHYGNRGQNSQDSLDNTPIGTFGRALGAFTDLDATGTSTLRGNTIALGTVNISNMLTVSSGGFDVTGASVVRGTFNATGGFFSSSTSSAMVMLTITTNGLLVQAGGADVTGNSVVRGNLVVTGTLTVGSNLIPANAADYVIGGANPGTVSGGQRLVIHALPHPVSFLAGLTGSSMTALTPALGQSVFTFAFTRSGVTTAIATLTFAPGGTAASFSGIVLPTLQAGDLLTLTAPTIADPTLADIGWSILAIKQ